MRRPERVDRLQQEADREERVDGDHAGFDLALDGREARAEAGLRRQDDERGVEAAHQDQREPHVAVAQIELIVTLVEGVVEGAIQLPRAERTGAVQLLGLPLAAWAVGVGADPDGRGCGLHNEEYRPMAGPP